MTQLRAILTYVFLSIMAFLSVFPFYWMIVGATNRSADIILGKSSFGSALWENIRTVFELNDMTLVLYNSFKVAIIGTILTLIIGSLAGYGFEIFKSKRKEKVFGASLLFMSIPFATLIVPLFILVGKMGLINSHWGVILPAIGGAGTIFMIFYFRQSAKAFPHELRDAARVDGLKEWQIFLFIYVPVMRSTYAAATIIVFMAQWNNFLWPLIALQTNEMKTITLAISAMIAINIPDYGAIMVATILATLPTIVIFFLLQRQFVQGMLGAVK